MDEDISDENLMLSYCDGNADAFDALYQRHKGPLYRFVLRQCGQEYTDELFQDIWLKVINARLTYTVKATFKTWLYRIARNRIIDHYRRMTVRPVENNPAKVASTSDDETGRPENSLEQAARHERLMQAISALPHEQKEVFLLKEEAGLDIAQIAETTGAGFEATKSRLRYAIEKLRAQLENTDEQR